MAFLTIIYIESSERKVSIIKWVDFIRDITFNAGHAFWYYKELLNKDEDSS